MGGPPDAADDRVVIYMPGVDLFGSKIPLSDGHPKKQTTPTDVLPQLLESKGITYEDWEDFLGELDKTRDKHPTPALCYITAPLLFIGAGILINGHIKWINRMMQTVHRWKPSFQEMGLEVEFIYGKDDKSSSPAEFWVEIFPLGGEPSVPAQQVGTTQDIKMKAVANGEASNGHVEANGNGHAAVEVANGEEPKE